MPFTTRLLLPVADTLPPWGGSRGFEKFVHPNSTSNFGRLEKCHFSRKENFVDVGGWVGGWVGRGWPGPQTPPPPPRGH